MTNLAECHEPLFELIRGLAVNGRKTARVNYGCGGWVSHHNADIWCQSAPVGDFGHGDPTWALWPMSGPWLCQHLWQHYEFGGDEAFLRDTAYPLMKGAAEFCLDFLIDDGKGHLVTAPSTSPENVFVTPDGQRSAVSMASTMDLELIHDLFTHCIARHEAPRYRRAVPRPARGGPGEALSRSRSVPTAACRSGSGRSPSRGPSPAPVPPLGRLSRQPDHAGRRRTCSRRPASRSKSASDEGTGWSSGWKISLWARLGDGDHALKLIRRTLRLEPGGVYVNLFGSHPPFQMDGNFAFPAGVAEMLLQSHAADGEIHLLPALPKAWPDGLGEGPAGPGRVRGGLAWKDGSLTSASIRSTRPVSDCTVRRQDGLDHDGTRQAIRAGWPTAIRRFTQRRKADAKTQRRGH